MVLDLGDKCSLRQWEPQPEGRRQNWAPGYFFRKEFVVFRMGCRTGLGLSFTVAQRANVFGKARTIKT
jgi:hypothetical protein